MKITQINMYDVVTSIKPWIDESVLFTEPRHLLVYTVLVLSFTGKVKLQFPSVVWNFAKFLLESGFSAPIKIVWPSTWWFYAIKQIFSGSTAILLYGWDTILPELSI